MTCRLPFGVPHWRGEELGAVLFDLDGTLMDTADDITVILNRALAEQHLGSLAADQVRELIGRGIPTLIARAVERLGASPMRRPRRSWSNAFIFTTSVSTGSMNAVRVHIRTRPRCSGDCAALGLNLAVVTNKKHDFAVGLLVRSGLGAWIDVIVGGDSCVRGKPDPQPLYFACNADACRTFSGSDGGRLVDGRARGARRRDAGRMRALRLQRGPGPAHAAV